MSVHGSEFFMPPGIHLHDVRSKFQRAEVEKSTHCIYRVNSVQHGENMSTCVYRFGRMYTFPGAVGLISDRRDLIPSVLGLGGFPTEELAE